MKIKSERARRTKQVLYTATIRLLIFNFWHMKYKKPTKSTDNDLKCFVAVNIFGFIGHYYVRVYVLYLLSSVSKGVKYHTNFLFVCTSSIPNFFFFAFLTEYSQRYKAEGKKLAPKETYCDDEHQTDHSRNGFVRIRVYGF